MINTIKTASSPYIIDITNNSNESIEFVTIGNSYADRFENNFGQHPNIEITYLIRDITYSEFLAHTEKKPFDVCKTIIKSTSTQQLDQPTSIIHPVIGQIGKPKERIIPRHQEAQIDELNDDYIYTFNGQTKLYFKYILANTKVTIYLYPN